MPAALRDGCFGEGSAPVPFEAARRRAVALARPPGRMTNVPLADAAGRVLAASIEAPHPLPPFDQAAMDGYAVRLSQRKDMSLVLPVIGLTRAGDAPGILAAGTAHRIMTGAALPGGADTVVMQEHAIRRGDLLQLGPDIRPGAHIRGAGEDVPRGAVVLRAGRRIGWPEIALLAALGIARVPVAPPLKIAIVTTGSELRGAGEPLVPGAIHDANGPMLVALLSAPDVEITLLSLRDDLDAIADAFSGLAGSADLVIASAGLSVGGEDHVRAAVARAGGWLDPMRIAMKPGKPLALGGLGDASFVGLPGNPQAAAFGALAFVRPMLSALLGEARPAPVTAEAAFACRSGADRTELIPVRLAIEQGRLTARRSGPPGSHRMMPMVAADAVAIVPPAPAAVEAGQVLEVLPFDRSRFGG